MIPLKIVKEYYRFEKGRMELYGRNFGMTDQRTIETSVELDLLINEMMKIRYPTFTHKRESS